MLIEERNLFKGMSPEFMSKVAQCSVSEYRSAGDILIHHGDPAQHLYILIEGRIRLSFGEQGYMSFVVSNSGDAVGLSSILGREEYHASAECLVPCLLQKIDKEELLSIFVKDPASGLQFYRRLANLLGQRLVDVYRSIPAAHGEKHAAPGG
jgi:CRP/FNR family cyclic AMP-dependent transcriptional regulator